MEPSRNYNLNRPIDEGTEAFEKELDVLIERYGAHCDTESFGKVFEDEEEGYDRF